MKLNFGSFVVSASGSLGSHIVSNCRGTQYLKNKSLSVNPATRYQGIIRSRFNAFSKGWSHLTESERLLWTQEAKSNQVVGKLGSILILTGQTLFIKVNQNLAKVNLPLISIPGQEGSIYGLLSLSIIALKASTNITLSWTPALPATHRLYIEACIPVTAGTTYVSKLYRGVSVVSSVGAVNVNIGSSYITRFGPWVA